MFYQERKACGSHQRQSCLHIAPKHRTLTRLGPLAQLKLDHEWEYIHEAGCAPATPTAAELERADAMGLCDTDQAGFFPSLPGGCFVRSEARNGVALGNDPAPAASRGHKNHLNPTTRIDEQRERTNLTQLLFPSVHGTAYPRICNSQMTGCALDLKDE